jgi:hypothetical protein
VRTVIRRTVIGCILLASGVLEPTQAAACGAAYPGGPAVCTMEHDAPKRAQGRVLASYAFTSTTLLFGGDRRADLTRHAVFAGAELPLSSRLSSTIGAGAVVAGTLERNADRFELAPGQTGFASIGWRAIDASTSAPWPFVQINTTLSVTHTRAGGAPFTAFDLRAAAVAGRTIEDVFTPYVVGRVFGGPIFWRIEGDDVTGTDLYKYQLGGGFSLALPSRVLDVFVEGIALGERGVAAGIGSTFF